MAFWGAGESKTFFDDTLATELMWEGYFAPPSGGPATYNESLTETGTAAETAATSATFAAAATEAVASADVGGTVATWPTARSETIAANDNAAAVDHIRYVGLDLRIDLDVFSRECIRSKAGGYGEQSDEQRFLRQLFKHDPLV